MIRHGQLIGIGAEAIAEYKRIHADVWPGVLAKISVCNIRNYSIFLKEPENLLFAYFEYVGTDFAADMAKMAADPETKRWWTVCQPMQRPLENRAEGEWWAEMEEVFHHD
ncbi:L-rhamnose mutarotase [Thalassospira alkalitolerans]|uniref:L-rhamnose mutarotase n=1 Tax=Thalassospira alkalitolerans TaxID=1293890 RepID=UPI0030EECCC3|tara:strand:+ start:4866 stop:5195 length:330 start_codon:yes stop_codon:yes gene_type:complete